MPMTWASLRTDLASQVGRDLETDDEFTAALPGILERAERRISRELNLSIFQGMQTGTMTVGNSAVSRPENVIAGVNFVIFLPSGEKVTLGWENLAWLEEWWPFPNQTEQPRYIAVRGDNSFQVAPPPDLPYAWAYNRRKHADFLSEANPSNELTQNYPDLLFYACAVEAAVYAQEDRRTGLKADYEERYQSLKLVVAAAEEALGMPQSETGGRVLQQPTEQPA